VRLAKSTVSCWVNQAHTPLGGINFFEPNPAPELAYVIGVLVGDASLNVRAKNYEYRIRLKAVDREFVQAFNVAISKVLNRRPHKIWKGNTERESYADVSSYLLHKFLNRPLDEFRPFIEYNAKCVSAFLRGFFDSEGSVAKDGDVTASNTDVDLLKYVQDLSSRFFGIETTGPHVGKKKGSVLIRRGKTYYRNSDVCVIRVRRVSLEFFDEFIGLTIHRKVSRRELAMIKYKFRMKYNEKS
jgi:intein-encoded DNA endonuclease-like protein